MFSYLSWKQKANKRFKTSKTLADGRGITLNPEFIDREKWPLEALLDLPEKTTQMASAVLLLDEDPPSIEGINLTEHQRHFLELTIRERKYWKERKMKGYRWHFVYDETIERQATAFLNNMRTGEMNFVAKQAEDYCFARAFGVMMPEEGEYRFPTLRGHETNRIREMERSMLLYRTEGVVDSPDHRIVQAIAMLAIVENKDIVIKTDKAVEKTWPQFWRFLEDYERFTSS